MEISYAKDYIQIDPTIAIIIRCPSCRQQGVFVSMGIKDLQNKGPRWLGIRHCPSPKCRAIIFFSTDQHDNIIVYPPETIDFDATNLPAAVTSALEEAILCHSNKCYKAAGIMIRKTLEEICEDKGATGKNLKERIEALRNTLVIPQELIDGMDILRLLGNDAAHIVSKVFNSIGEKEIKISIEFTKEILKAAYQYTSLLQNINSLRK